MSDEKVKGPFEAHLDVCEYCVGNYLCDSAVIIVRTLLIEKEARIKEKEERIQQLIRDVNEADGMHIKEVEKNWDMMNKVERLEARMKELERKLKVSEDIRIAEKKILIGEIEKNQQLTEGIESILGESTISFTVEKELKELIEGREGK